MTLFIGSQNIISPPSFMFVSAVVSEIRELNQNKRKEEKNSEIGHFHSNKHSCAQKIPLVKKLYRQ